MASVVNLSLSVLKIGTGLTLNGDTLSASPNTSVLNSIIAAAGSTLSLASNDSVGASLVLGLGNTLTSTGSWQGLVLKTNNQSGSYSISAIDVYVGYTGAGGHTFTLPTAASQTGRLYFVKSRGGTLTLAVASAGELWTNTNVSSMSLIAGECAVVISDGTYWIVAAMASGLITP